MSHLARPYSSRAWTVPTTRPAKRHTGRAQHLASWCSFTLRNCVMAQSSFVSAPACRHRCRFTGARVETVVDRCYIDYFGHSCSWNDYCYNVCWKLGVYILIFLQLIFKMSKFNQEVVSRSWMTRDSLKDLFDEGFSSWCSKILRWTDDKHSIQS